MYLKQNTWLFHLIVIPAALLVIISCEKESTEKQESVDLTYLSTEYEGCNESSRMTLQKASESIVNQVIISEKKDTLSVKVGLHYLCCAVFDSKTKMVNDTLQLDIIDLTSEFQKSYCRCQCTYGFHFHFKMGENYSCPFRINLITNENKKGSLIYSGTLRGKKKAFNPVLDAFLTPHGDSFP